MGMYIPTGDYLQMEPLFFQVSIVRFKWNSIDGWDTIYVDTVLLHQLPQSGELFCCVDHLVVIRYSGATRRMERFNLGRWGVLNDCLRMITSEMEYFDEGDR